MREMWFATLIAVALAGAFPAVAQAPKSADGASAERLLAPTGQDRVLGQSDAPVTIIEYASLTCPHCAHFTKEVLPKLKEKWIDTGKAKLILRAYPLDEAALRAAMVARCAPSERYYPLVETFFETQDKWALAKDYRATLERLTRLAGIGKKEFDACFDDKALEDEVTQSRLTASTQLGVQATPTFFINGKKFEGEPTFEAIDRMMSGLAEKS
jgi:protein-disulfide isomerase